MPVSGIVILCTEGSAETVAQTLASTPGIEIYGVLPENRVIAVVEADTIEGEVDLVSSLHDLQGIISVQVAYHNFEDVC